MKKIILSIFSILAFSFANASTCNQMYSEIIGKFYSNKVSKGDVYLKDLMQIDRLGSKYISECRCTRPRCEVYKEYLDKQAKLRYTMGINGLNTMYHGWNFLFGGDENRTDREALGRLAEAGESHFSMKQAQDEYFKNFFSYPHKFPL